MKSFWCWLGLHRGIVRDATGRVGGILLPVHFEGHRCGRILP